MSNQQPNQDTQGGRQIQIKVSDEVLRGVYANAMQIAHTKDEFVMDLMNIIPHQNIGTVNARVIVSPGHLKRMIAALQDNLEKYEGQFGKVEATKQPEGMGFTAE